MLPTGPYRKVLKVFFYCRNCYYYCCNTDNCNNVKARTTNGKCEVLNGKNVDQNDGNDNAGNKTVDENDGNDNGGGNETVD